MTLTEVPKFLSKNNEKNLYLFYKLKKSLFSLIWPDLA